MEALCTDLAITVQRGSKLYNDVGIVALYWWLYSRTISVRCAVVEVGHCRKDSKTVPAVTGASHNGWDSKYNATVRASQPRTKLRILRQALLHGALLLLLSKVNLHCHCVPITCFGAIYLCRVLMLMPCIEDGLNEIDHGRICPATTTPATIGMCFVPSQVPTTGGLHDHDIGIAQIVCQFTVERGKD